MQIQHRITEEVAKAIATLWPHLETQDIPIEYPPRPSFGDYSVSVAMKVSALVSLPPREVAQQIASKLPTMKQIAQVTIEGPGFLNFFLSDAYLESVPAIIKKRKLSYSESTIGKKQHVNIEFISANPTGPLTFANGRGGFFGDTLARILQKTGHVVEREYYVNDAGNQVNILAESVLRKYFTQQGIPTEYPEYCYQGTYVDELASSLKIPNYNLAKHGLKEIRDKIKDKIVAEMLKDIKRVLSKKMQIFFDTFYSEKTLYEKGGRIDQLQKYLAEQQMTYEKDGALWLKTTQFGDDKDRVLIKRDGEYTYLLSDVAYHWEKFTHRGFDRVIDLFGADHNPGRMYAAMRMFGVREKLSIILMQMVRLMDHGKEMKMSKRAGTYITIEEVIDEVGIDATRFFFLLYAPNTHMDFDLQLAKDRSEKNPVYYVQYAHARMCSILKVVTEKQTSLSHTTELSGASRKILVNMLRWPELLERASATTSVHILAQFALESARAVHEWYDKERVITQDGVVNASLLRLVEATQLFLEDVLTTLGVSAPRTMD